MFNNVFNQVDRQMRQSFDEWTVNFDDFFSDIEPLPDIGLESGGKNYSISYHYETGMKEPEIRISGDVDDKGVKKFLKNMEKRYGHLGLTEKQTKMLGKGKEETPEKVEKHEKEHETITLEMPGIAKENIEINVQENSVEVTGKKDKLYYRKRIPLGFKPGKEVKFEADNGLITVEINET